ncbi:MAG: heparinase II/III domain-containing protein [Myxococcota bacterium]
MRRARWQRRSGAVDARYRRRAEALPPLRWDHAGLARVAAWRAGERPVALAQDAADAALEGRFRFLSREEALGDPVDWFRPDLDQGTRLWKTHLHEFSFATDLARAARRTGDPRYRARLFDLARGWRAAAPIGCRDFALDSWNARAVATRLVHWAVAGRTLDLAADDPDAQWLGREIGLHGLFLRDNLELDLRGNHLFRDAVGLVFANELVGGVPDALDWLEAQVDEQVLPDGGHQERAPLYHALCTRDLLEVRLLLGAASPDWLDDALGRMSGFLAAIALGDGEIPLLGDGWLGEVSTPALLAAAAREVPARPPERPERHSGLATLTAGPWRAVVRAGPHAPDEQMGHAHADLLSLDASCGERRVVTDTGTLLYDPGPERDRLRGTLAHNTLRIDGEEQLEVWSSFRAGRRGRARFGGRGRVRTAGGGTWRWLAASHDAYSWRPGLPMHHRLVALGDAGLVILDFVAGSGVHRIESGLHAHPDAADVPFAALGAQPATAREAPLHERFGETRPMTRHGVDVTAPLPWVGGWAVGDVARFHRRVLRLDGPRVELAIEGSVPLRIAWRPDVDQASEAVFLALPGPARAAN